VVGSKLVLAVVAALLLAGCGASTTETSEPATTGGGGGGPRIAGAGLDGTRVDVADLRGKPVFVNVWSSW
jgi:hypothetical protein